MKKCLFLTLVALICFALWPVLAQAKPFVVCDPYPAAISLDGFRISIDDGAWIDIPVVANPDGTKQIKYDLAPLNLANGAHVLKARAYNMWGDGDVSDPFSFTSGVPGKPTTIRLTLQ